ncbi:hypothetical protein IWW45_007251, partial [Coemansia sp. RSA 485]
NSLPTPRALPMQSRLGGIGAGAMASAAIMAAAQQQQQEQMMAIMAMNGANGYGANGSGQGRQNRGQQRYGANRNRHRKPDVTEQDLNDDLDSYMKDSTSTPDADKSQQ